MIEVIVGTTKIVKPTRRGVKRKVEKSPEPPNTNMDEVNIGIFEIPHFFAQGGSTDQLLNMWGQTPHMR